MKKLKVAIVHDWFVGGGAEQVVFEFHKLFPDAPIYTSYCSPEWQGKLDGKIVTGFLQKWPFSKLRKFLPLLRIWWFSRLKFDGYDLVLSSSGAEAKGINVPAGTIHINYCHAPTHYYWSRYEQYLKEPGFGWFNWLARVGLRLLVAPLRRWDYRAAQKPDFMIANSTYTKDQITKYYGRESAVIYPPIDTERFGIPHERHGLSNERKGFVTTGRQTPYKRIDLAVAACSELNVPLIVIGRGPEHRKLKKMAGKTVTFLTKVSNEELPHYLQSAEAFLFPGIDDFGIAAVEALAAGTPVVAFRAGGALDYVIEGQTGVFFNEQTVESLADCLKTFNPDKFDEKVIRNEAATFTATKFESLIARFISQKVTNMGDSSQISS